MVSASMLSDTQTVNLLSVDLLCGLCRRTDKQWHTECLVSDLVKLIDCDNEERWSCPKAFDVHLVRIYVVQLW